MNDAQIAMKVIEEFFKLLKNTITVTATATMKIGDEISNTFKEGINKIRNDVKTERGNKAGEVSKEKLEKNHDNKTAFKVIDEVNLDKFKKSAEINNLQYAVVKQPDNTVAVHYAEKHSNKMEATMDTVVRSVAVEKEEKANKIIEAQKETNAERTISKDDNVKAVIDKEMKELLQELKIEIAELRKENLALKEKINEIEKNDPFKEVKDLVKDVKDNKDKEILKDMGKESLDNLIKNATEKAKDQPVNQIKQPALER